MAGKTKRTSSLRVKIEETIDPADGEKFKYLHDSGTWKTSKTLAAGLAHSKLVSSGVSSQTETWLLNALAHPTGEIRNYVGCTLISLTIVAISGSSDYGFPLGVIPTHDGAEFGLSLFTGGLLFQTFTNWVVGANDSIDIQIPSGDGVWRIILEFAPAT